jgi:YHS domain-containing protein
MLRWLVELILFTIAISVIRSVIAFVQRAFTGGRQPSKTVRGPAAGTSGQGTPSGQGTTMLQQDPVCGTYVAVDSSLKRVVNGRVLHFCSPECRDKYSS